MTEKKKLRLLRLLSLLLILFAVTVPGTRTAKAVYGASLYTESYGANLTGSYKSGIPFSRWKRASEYTSTVMMANFRAVKGGNMGTGVLFRSRQPDLLKETGKVTDLLMADAGVKYVINLCETNTELRKKFADSRYSSYYYYKLFKKGNVTAASTTLAFKTKAQREANRRAMIAGFKTIAAHGGPYLVHCAVGKDRTGEFCMIAGALMGASYNQLLSDYMQTYLNYGANSSRAGALSFCKKNLDYLLQVMTYSPSGSNWSKMDLAAKAERYLKDGGLNSGQIRSIRRHLSASYTAQTRLVAGNYMLTVKFKDGVTGKIISRRRVAYGKSVKFPTIPTHAGYEFVKWTSAGTSIKKDCTITAVFQKVAVQEYGKGLTGTYTSGSIPFSKWKTASEYTTNAMMANFRAAKGGKISSTALYRSKLPTAKNDASRIADLMAQDAGVKYVINLCETADTISGKLANSAYSSYYYYKLYRGGKVVADRTSLTMSTRAQLLSNRKAMVKGFQTIAAHPGPYLVHCAAGMDRTGEFCMIAEALMGASYNEILNDYMQTFLNYGSNSSRAGALSYCKKNLDYLLQLMTYNPSGSSWSAMDLAAKAERYLLDGGMTKSQISAVKKNLSRGYTGMTRTKNGNYYLTVKYKDGVTGKIIGSEKVAYGKNAAFVDLPEHEGYTFVKWSAAGTKIRTDCTITATFKKN